MTSLSRAAIAEALTLLALLCISMPLKHIFENSLAISVIGPAQGLAFMVFLWFVIRSWAEGEINERWLRHQRTGAGAQ